MNLPNAISLSRIPLMFAIAGLMYCDWLGAASFAFWLFIVAACGDWLDGHLARKRGLVSSFGKLMDALADKIMVLGLVIVLVDKHQLPVSLALITLCREFLVTGMAGAPWSRIGTGIPLCELGALGFADHKLPPTTSLLGGHKP